MRVGLTGGIGSGKSEVARMLERCGALVIDADELAREAVEPGSHALHAIARRWPSVIAGGALDRAALAQIVFADESARAELNAIVHPVVRELGASREERAKTGQLIVHVVPLLFETGFDKRVDATVVVVSSAEDRIARVVARDGMREADVRARIAAQIDPDIARRRANYVVENDGNLAALHERVQALYQKLLND